MPAAAIQLSTRLEEARALTDSLWPLLRPGVLATRPIADRHRLIFYLGHLEAFDWNLVGRRGFGEASFHPTFDRLFEFGIDPAPGQGPDDEPGDWPGESEIRHYNRRTREMLDRRLADASFTDAQAVMLEAAIEHRLMHAETLAYLLHNLPYEAKVPSGITAKPGGGAVTKARVEVPAGEAVLGKEADGSFGWDNEYARHTVEVPAFRTGQYKVTNGEYLRFVQDGAAAPHFWTSQQGEWHYRGMFQPVRLPLDAPVYVTQRQAAAYAEWAGGRLLTEAEFHRCAAEMPAAPGNYDFAAWDPVSVAETAPLIGNGWEWTGTVFAPFAGFAPFDFYPGYSADFFDGEHFVLKGASPRTAACLVRPSFRNWFRSDYPYAYATFRVVEESV